MKKILPVAVLAALAGVNAAQAVHVNGDGTGQVLVFPFYTVEGGHDTYINLVNTTDQYKAVKVRVLESMNSQEVLDFNLYLSPQDHWSAVITTDAGGGAAIQSQDNSCTVPLAISNHAKVPFRKFQYDIAPEKERGIDRTREGYLEVIEMATVIDSTYTSAIQHDSDGVPGDCPSLDAAWATGGSWSDSDGEDGVTAVTGGLYGYGVLIDVNEGTDSSYDAIAIDDWIDSQGNGFFHSGPGDLLPSIASEADLSYDVFDEGGVVSGVALDGADSVSATLMQATISNDYVLESTIDAGTDWVVTFPTKRFYVNTTEVIPPFTDEWHPETSTACEIFGIAYWNREEGTPVDPVDPNDFSPLPPPGVIPTFSFCHEANVLTFNNSDVLSASARTGVNLNLEDGFENGWARIDFTGEGRELVTLDNVFNGLPVVGFAVQKYVNGEIPSVNPLANGQPVLANYATSVLHKGDRLISSGD